MTATEYFRHARSLGAFRAVDALALAREAAALDEAHRIATPPAQVWHEVNPDGSGRVSLSAGVLVF